MNFPQAKHFKIVAHEPIKAAANLLNVALVNPPDPQSAGNERLMPPLGLGYIASYARAIGHDVDLFDYALDLDVSEEYLQKTGLFGKEYAVYGISTYTDTFAQGIKLAEKIRKNRPRCKIVMGGYHVSILHEETLRDFPVIDAVVRGEGEVTFSKYLEALSAGDEAMALLPGLTWRSGERVISNASAKTLVEQDLIPVPARDFKYSPGSYVEYLSRESGVTRRTISMVSSRGCPKRCTFCSITVLDPLWRARSVESMMFEIRKLYEQAPFDHILFEDANFFVRPTRTLEFSRKLFEFNPRITWSGTSTPDHIVKHKDVIKEIGALNCAALEVGIESGNEGSLKRFGKGNTVETNKAVIAVLEGSGIALGLDFIMFDPMMTTRELDANLDFIAGCGFQDSWPAPVFQEVLLYPGTQIRSEYFQEFGGVEPVHEIPETNFMDSTVARIFRICRFYHDRGRHEVDALLRELYQTLNAIRQRETAAPLGDLRDELASSYAELAMQTILVRQLSYRFVRVACNYCKENPEVDQEYLQIATAIRKMVVDPVVHQARRVLSAFLDSPGAASVTVVPDKFVRSRAI